MITQDLAIILGTVEIANLLGKDYFRSKIMQAAQSVTMPNEDEYKIFIGFESKNNLWTTFGFVGVNAETGETRVLDFRLPSGFRMKKPIMKVLRS